MYWSAELVALVPPDVVTVTSTVPTEPAGLVAVMLVALFTVKLVAGVLPNLTTVAPVKLVPVIVTMVPPETGPFVGLTEVTAIVAGEAVPLKEIDCFALVTYRLLSIRFNEPLTVPEIVPVGAKLIGKVQLAPAASVPTDPPKLTSGQDVLLLLFHVK